jgi:RNA-binding protein YhbY
MLRDTLASLDQLAAARELIRVRIPSAAQTRVTTLQNTIRAKLARREAYNDVSRPHVG